MALAAQLDRSYQQIQKYEKGINSVSAVMLLELASTFGVPTAWLLEESPARLSNDNIISDKLNLRMFGALSKINPIDRLMATRMVERFAEILTVKSEPSAVTRLRGVTAKEVSPSKTYP